MRWEPLAKASESLKFGKDALRSRGSRGSWPRQEGPQGEWLYAVPEDAGEARSIRVDRYAGGGVIEKEKPEAKEKAAPFKVLEPEHGGKYYYDDTRDIYVFNLPSKPRSPWVVAGVKVRDLVAAYSNQGDDATINQIARTFGWHRKTVMETLKCLGKTHDSLPYTDEHIAASTEEELAEDLVRRREERAHIIAEQRDWKRIKNLAHRAQNWERFISETLSNVDVGPPPAMPKWKRNAKKSSDKTPPFTVVTHPTDLHYGKEGWKAQVGEDGEFNREICEQRLIETNMELIGRIERWGLPQRAIIAAGADWFHVDNHRGTTTRGTPQDTDGNFLRIFKEGCELARNYIEIWRQFVPEIYVPIVRGNHDYYTTAMMGMWLQALYADAEDVTIGRCELDREYMKVGTTLLGITHGDSVKDKDLVSLMAYEAKDVWSETDYRLILTGHWHSQISTEHHGVLVDHLPSLAGTDRWHNAHGYVGNRKALMAHLVDHDRGPFAKVLADVR